MKKPRLIVRALIVDENRVLVNERAGYLSLFGGRVEKGETARSALGRELAEELGVRTEVGRLAYLIENFFVDRRGRRIHELGLYYHVKAGPFAARERGLAPFWLPLDKVAGSPLQPHALRDRLAADLASPPTTVVELVEIDRVNFPEVK